MELVAKLTEASIKELEEMVTKRFFAAQIPVDNVSFAKNENDSDTVDIIAELRFSIVHYTTLRHLCGSFQPSDIDIGHTVVNNEMTLTIIMHDVQWEYLGIKTKFVL